MRLGNIGSLTSWRSARPVMVALLVIALGGAGARAAVVIETPGPLTGEATRPSGTSWGVLARVDVGPANVAINQIGVKGQVLTSTTLKFVLYQGSTLGALPTVQTATQNLPAPTAAQWFESEQFPTFTLQANTTYWIGYACNGAVDTFRSFYNLNGATSFSANGLTLPAGTNGNVRTSYATPTLDPNSGTVQGAVRLSLVPEPSSLALMLLSGGGALRACRRRRW
jgi:hypothetical protein